MFKSCGMRVTARLGGILLNTPLITMPKSVMFWRCVMRSYLAEALNESP
jgi:hypothetical protein